MIPLVDLSQDSKTLKAVRSAIDKVIATNSFILGGQLEAFEKKFGEFLDSPYVCGVASGTDAIRLSLRALGVAPGDKVLTVSFTSPFTIIGILEEGAIPVFCDIDPETWTIDPKDAAKKIDSDVRAIIPVHIYGSPCDMDSILALARETKIKVIEDACQAHGATIGGKFVGTFGDAAAFSFYPTKNLGGFGDGGSVTTDDEKVYDSIKILRHGGQTRRFWHEFAGAHSRLDEIQAAILQVKLTRLAQDNKKREEISKRYREELSDLPLEFQKVLPEAKSANHLFVVTTKERDQLKKYLESKDIASDIHYPYPTYRQPAFSKYSNGRLEVTEDVQAKILSLPIYPSLAANDQDKVISEIRNFFKS
ncbi:MAG: DegT/DnrJ/EryC1/StrS family aminotransferase [Candidatus Curtissbacteria bacterium]